MGRWQAPGSHHGLVHSAGLGSCSGRAPHPAAEAAARESASCWAPHRGELAGGWQEQAEAGIPPGHQTISRFPLPRVWHTAGGRQAGVAPPWAVSICRARCPAACVGTAVTLWSWVPPPRWLLGVVLAQRCIITVAALLLRQGIPPLPKTQEKLLRSGGGLLRSSSQKSTSSPCKKVTQSRAHAVPAALASSQLCFHSHLKNDLKDDSCKWHFPLLPLPPLTSQPCPQQGEAGGNQGCTKALAARGCAGAVQQELAGAPWGQDHVRARCVPAPEECD